MADSRTPQPTASELAILQVLWRDGPATVRQIHQRLPRTPAVRYTTTLKLLQIMLQKKLVRRDTSSRSHVYTAAIARDPTHRGMLSELIDRVFEGSAARLVVGALSSRRASPAELAEIRKTIDDAERAEKCTADCRRLM